MQNIKLIRTALGQIESKTCVKFIQITVNDTSYENFIQLNCNAGEGCKSELGYKGRPQKLNLQLGRTETNEKKGCMKIRNIQHEFMHALGFQHEHNSPFRDQFVKIIPKNIAKGWERYFFLGKSKKLESFGCDYDYNSIMQVDAYRHSGNNQPTIISLNQLYNSTTLGKAQNISDCDVIRIQNMYCSDNEKKNYLPTEIKENNTN